MSAPRNTQRGRRVGRQVIGRGNATSRSLGKSLRLFKSELHELHTEDKADEPAARHARSR